VADGCVSANSAQALEISAIKNFLHGTLKYFLISVDISVPILE
jgi:hypothetical protein